MRIKTDSNLFISLSRGLILLCFLPPKCERICIKYGFWINSSQLTKMIIFICVTGVSMKKDILQHCICEYDLRPILIHFFFVQLGMLFLTRGRCRHCSLRLFGYHAYIYSSLLLIEDCLRNSFKCEFLPKSNYFRINVSMIYLIGN